MEGRDIGVKPQGIRRRQPWEEGRAERSANAKALRLQERFRCLWKRKKATVMTAEWLSGRKDGAMQDHVGL